MGVWGTERILSFLAERITSRQTWAFDISCFKNQLLLIHNDQFGSRIIILHSLETQHLTLISVVRAWLGRNVWHSCQLVINEADTAPRLSLGERREKDWELLWPSLEFPCAQSFAWFECCAHNLDLHELIFLKMMWSWAVSQHCSPSKRKRIWLKCTLKGPLRFR